ncbi:unnamed protein product [Dibothriocephalus latus]|uniref:Dynein heavy chain AAA 5 extension domain-containing protein n=1 Tax=Dibothriocephalus latus TaxID=60516 RepID=A0A3P6QVF9_DIBLA|nr:unnamed protein product [Dibothriocephalus latus]
MWIESMNSVMDDNKILTLINGERISMPDPVSLLFEVEDLAVASPATVSRAGMVYNDVHELGWWPYVNCWIAGKTGKVLIETLKMLFNKDLTKILEFVQRSCNKLIPVSEISLIIGLCRLFDGLFGDGSEVMLPYSIIQTRVWIT